MNYSVARITLAHAWLAFEYELYKQGVTNEQIVKIKEMIDRKDAYNGVRGAVIEVLVNDYN